MPYSALDQASQSTQHNHNVVKEENKNIYKENRNDRSKTIKANRNRSYIKKDKRNNYSKGDLAHNIRMTKEKNYKVQGEVKDQVTRTSPSLLEGTLSMGLEVEVSTSSAACLGASAPPLGVILTSIPYTTIL